MDVCTKFGGDWYGRLCVKEGHRYIQSKVYSLFYIDRSNKRDWDYGVV